ncbi:MAG: sodium ion-translocating decarboxylase subunit beta, partial [Clostridia bacterium]
MEGFNVGESLLKLVQTSGIADLFRDPKPLIMIVIACVLLYLAIVKKYEPLLLMPIAFGMLLANLPLAGIMGEPTYQYLSEAVHNGKNGVPVLMENGDIVYQ